jgi:hypothetical protein
MCAAKSGRSGRVVKFLHLLAYAVTFGSAVWMTFFSGRVLSQTIPREQFRNVQTKMFPYFLKFMVSGEAVLTVLYALMSGSSSKWLFGLLILIAATAYNAFVLEPKTTKVQNSTHQILLDAANIKGECHVLIGSFVRVTDLSREVEAGERGRQGNE